MSITNESYKYNGKIDNNSKLNICFYTDITCSNLPLKFDFEFKWSQNKINNLNEKLTLIRNQQPKGISNICKYKLIGEDNCHHTLEKNDYRLNIKTHSKLRKISTMQNLSTKFGSWLSLINGLDFLCQEQIFLTDFGLNTLLLDEKSNIELSLVEIIKHLVINGSGQVNQKILCIRINEIIYQVYLDNLIKIKSMLSQLSCKHCINCNHNFLYFLKKAIIEQENTRHDNYLDICSLTSVYSLNTCINSCCYISDGYFPKAKGINRIFHTSMDSNISLDNFLNNNTYNLNVTKKSNSQYQVHYWRPFYKYNIENMFSDKHDNACQLFKRLNDMLDLIVNILRCIYDLCSNLPHLTQIETDHIGFNSIDRIYASDVYVHTICSLPKNSARHNDDIKIFWLNSLIKKITCDLVNCYSKLNSETLNDFDKECLIEYNKQFKKYELKCIKDIKILKNLIIKYQQISTQKSSEFSKVGSFPMIASQNDLNSILSTHNHNHQAKPSLVYLIITNKNPMCISFPKENLRFHVASVDDKTMNYLYEFNESTINQEILNIIESLPNQGFQKEQIPDIILTLCRLLLYENDYSLKDDKIEKISYANNTLYFIISKQFSIEKQSNSNKDINCGVNIIVYNLIKQLWDMFNDENLSHSQDIELDQKPDGINAIIDLNLSMNKLIQDGHTQIKQITNNLLSTRKIEKKYKVSLSNRMPLNKAKHLKDKYNQIYNECQKTRLSSYINQDDELLLSEEYQESVIILVIHKEEIVDDNLSEFDRVSLQLQLLIQLIYYLTNYHKDSVLSILPKGLSLDNLMLLNQSYKLSFFGPCLSIDLLNEFYDGINLDYSQKILESLIRALFKKYSLGNEHFEELIKSNIIQLEDNSQVNALGLYPQFFIQDFDNYMRIPIGYRTLQSSVGRFVDLTIFDGLYHDNKRYFKKVILNDDDKLPFHMVEYDLQNGSISYYGEYDSNLKPHNSGRIYNKDYIYIGNFKNGLKNGKGDYYNLRTKEHYEGDFKDDKYHGFGKIYYGDDKLKYEGNWVDGELEGKATYIDLSGKKYIGEFHKTDLHGYGIWYYGDTDKIESKGVFYEGKRNGDFEFYDVKGSLLNKRTFIRDVMQKPKSTIKIVSGLDEITSTMPSNHESVAISNYQTPVIASNLQPIILSNSQPIIISSYKPSMSLNHQSTTIISNNQPLMPSGTQIHIPNQSDPSSASTILYKNYGMNIYQSQIEILLGNKWLDSKIINFFVSYLEEKHDWEYYDESKSLLSYQYFQRILVFHDSMFSFMTSNTNKLSYFKYSDYVSLQTKPYRGNGFLIFDIFDRILFVININNFHWCLAEINTQNKDNYKFIIYDSAGGVNPQRDELLVLKKYALEEVKNKCPEKQYQQQYLEKIENGEQIAANVNKQQNGYDCGVFVCGYLNDILKQNSIPNFHQFDVKNLRLRLANVLVGKEKEPVYNAETVNKHYSRQYTLQEKKSSIKLYFD